MKCGRRRSLGAHVQLQSVSIDMVSASASEGKKEYGAREDFKTPSEVRPTLMKHDPQTAAVLHGSKSFSGGGSSSILAPPFLLHYNEVHSPNAATRWRRKVSRVRTVIIRPGDGAGRVSELGCVATSA